MLDRRASCLRGTAKQRNARLRVSARPVKLLRRCPFQVRRENRFMNVVVYGATGKTGSRVIQELLLCGHQVTAVVRDLGKASSLPSVAVKQDDLSDVSRIAGIIREADAVVSAYAPPPDRTDEVVEVTKRQIEAVKQVGEGMRLIVVGGAAGLYVAPGLTLLESGHLPEVWRSIATSHFKAFAVLQASDINWTYFAPAAFFEPGERMDKAESPWKITPSRLSTNWSVRSTCASALQSATDPNAPGISPARSALCYCSR